MNLTLEELLKRTKASLENLSPYVRRNYVLSSPLAYRYSYLKPDSDRTRASMSPGERNIDDYLGMRNVPREYEPLLIVEEAGSDVVRLRYPDFYLPEQGVFIEYNGGEGNQRDDLRYAAKSRDYEKNNVPYVVIHRNEMRSYAWAMKLDRVLRDYPRGRNSYSRGFYN